MTIAFIKMHGLGNDFAVIKTDGKTFDISAERISRWADRHRGIGFDQLILIDPPRRADTDAFMRIYNADGSEAGACGNASRCVAKLLIQDLKKTSLRIETKAAILSAWPEGDGRITVDMGLVHTGWRDIPLARDVDTNATPVNIDPLHFASCVNVGNPHAVFFVDNVDTVDLAVLGPQVEHHGLFPERVNVEVAQVIAPNTIRMKVWERGVGITQACGTGACAVAIAGLRRNLTSQRVTVILDGGTLDIAWEESDNHIRMTGDATEAYRGTIEE